MICDFIKIVFVLLRCFQNVSISDHFQVVVLRPLKVPGDSVFMCDGVCVKNVNISQIYFK